MKIICVTLIDHCLSISFMYKKEIIIMYLKWLWAWGECVTTKLNFSTIPSIWEKLYFNYGTMSWIFELNFQLDKTKKKKKIYFNYTCSNKVHVHVLVMYQYIIVHNLPGYIYTKTCYYYFWYILIQMNYYNTVIYVNCYVLLHVLIHIYSVIK